jgi:hypothetical protein
MHIYIYTHTHTHTHNSQIDPNHVKSLCNYAVLLRDGDKDIEAARTLMERARQAAPDDDWFKQIDQEKEWSKHVNVRPGKASVGVRAGNTPAGIPVSNTGGSMGGNMGGSGREGAKQRTKKDSRPSLHPIQRNSGVSVYRGGAFQDGARIPPHPEAEFDAEPGARLPRGMTQDHVPTLNPEDLGIETDEYED